MPERFLSPVYFIISFLGLQLLTEFCFETKWGRETTASLTMMTGKAAAQILHAGPGSYSCVREGSFVVIRKWTTPVVYVGDPCNGRSLITVFAGLVVVWKFADPRLPVFLVAGSLFLIMVNSIRVAMLALLYQFHAPLAAIHHKYIFTLVSYGLIALLFRYWVHLAPRTRAGPGKGQSWKPEVSRR